MADVEAPFAVEVELSADPDSAPLATSLGSSINTALVVPCIDFDCTDLLRLSGEAGSVVDRFYEEQRLRSCRERDRQQEGENAATAKTNRQGLYLDSGHLHAGIAASRQHLALHPLWWRGASRIDTTSLCDVVALQHFLAVDLEDLTLPPERRRTEDVFCDDGVCEQFLLDAPRGTYDVEGKVFDFSREMTQKGPRGTVDGIKLAEQQRLFCGRLVAAVRDCLGEREEAPSQLVQAVTTVMSQSGLASLERACSMPQLAVSGGVQSVTYALRRVAREGEEGEKGFPPSAAWELKLGGRKSGFEQFIVYAAAEPCGAVLSWQEGEQRRDYQVREPLLPGGEGGPVACGRASLMEKSCSLRFQVDPATKDVALDVVGLRKRLVIADRNGREWYSLEGGTDAGADESRWRLRLLTQLLLLLFQTCVETCRRLFRQRSKKVHMTRDALLVAV